MLRFKELLIMIDTCQAATLFSQIKRLKYVAISRNVHTYDYARHLISACTCIFRLEGSPEGVEDQGRLTRVVVFPIGMDSDRFLHALRSPQVHEHIEGKNFWNKGDVS
ncbi:hypothetical protein L2E82_14908 [Cichorium intybus]|uniref:Uncharacterized protein n=1 Tax=Cichorium intybus TaxID=13427 RepID=A0ACB9F2H0_CICIN|nr:hypothetical protein L2E82_14908 [Cichorium intybus]